MVDGGEGPKHRMESSVLEVLGCSDVVPALNKHRML